MDDETEQATRAQLAARGLTDEQIERGALTAALTLIESAQLSTGAAAEYVAKTVDTFRLQPPAGRPRLQVLALPPERVHDAEANPFILVFDRVTYDSSLYRDLVAAREGLEIGTGTRAVMIFADEVDVVPGFELDPALAAKVRAAVERWSA